MSCHLSKELRAKHGVCFLSDVWHMGFIGTQVRALPVRKDDEVRVMVGKKRKGTQGKVVAVYRKKWVIHIDRFQTNKINGLYT